MVGAWAMGGRGAVYSWWWNCRKPWCLTSSSRSLIRIFSHHFPHQFAEGGAGRPAKLSLGFAGIAEQGFDFGGTGVARVHRTPATALVVVALLVHALAAPGDAHAQFRRGLFDEFPHAMLFAGGDDVVFGPVLLQHQPLHLDVIAGVAPVAPGGQVAEVETVLQAELDAGQGAGDFAGDESLAAQGRFVVEQDAVAGVMP